MNGSAWAHERKLEWVAELRVRLRMKAQNDRRIQELEDMHLEFFGEKFRG